MLDELLNQALMLAIASRFAFVSYAAFARKLAPLEQSRPDYLLNAVDLGRVGRMFFAYGLAWLALGLVPTWFDTHSRVDLLFYAAWLPLALAIPRLCLGPDRAYRQQVWQAFALGLGERGIWLYCTGIVVYIALHHAVRHSAPTGVFGVAPICAIFFYQALRAFRLRRAVAA